MTQTFSKKFVWIALLGALTLSLVAGVAFAAAPDGTAGPWADFAVSYDPGLRDNGTPVDPARTITDNALGVAENNDTINFLALGYGGSVVLGFNNGIANGAGADFRVVETTFGSPTCENYPERATLEVSEDGVTWYMASAPINDCQDLEFDIGTVVDEEQNEVELSCVNYVRITDTTDFEEFPDNLGHITDGFDVDGVEALHEGGECVPGDIDIDKSASALEVAPGEEVTYTYIVTNPGVVDLDTVVVTDDKCAPVEYVSGDDGGDGILEPGEEWTYECAVALNETTLNTGTVTADNPHDQEVTDSDTAEVAVADPGCTLTQGYWKNHSAESKHEDPTWNGQENTAINGIVGWLSILKTPPKNGDAWYSLAHQWIAATLNVQAGADDTDVATALTDAEALLESYLPGVLTGKNKDATAKADRAEAITLAGILGSFNEGEIGPGHCSETEDEEVI